MRRALRGGATSAPVTAVMAAVMVAVIGVSVSSCSGTERVAETTAVANPGGSGPGGTGPGGSRGGGSGQGPPGTVAGGGSTGAPGPSLPVAGSVDAKAEAVRASIVLTDAVQREAILATAVVASKGTKWKAEWEAAREETKNADAAYQAAVKNGEFGSASQPGRQRASQAASGHFSTRLDVERPDADARNIADKYAFSTKELTAGTLAMLDEPASGFDEQTAGVVAALAEHQLAVSTLAMYLVAVSELGTYPVKERYTCEQAERCTYAGRVKDADQSMVDTRGALLALMNDDQAARFQQALDEVEFAADADAIRRAGTGPSPSEFQCTEETCPPTLVDEALDQNEIYARLAIELAAPLAGRSTTATSRRSTAQTSR